MNNVYKFILINVMLFFHKHKRLVLWLKFGDRVHLRIWVKKVFDQFRDFILTADIR